MPGSNPSPIGTLPFNNNFCGYFKPVLCTPKETCCAREAGDEPDSRRATGGADEETAGRGGADEGTLGREARIQQEVGRGKNSRKA